MTIPFSQKLFPQKSSFLQKFQHEYQNILRVHNMRSKFVFSIEKAAVEQLRQVKSAQSAVEQTRPVVAQDAAEQTRPGRTVCCRTDTSRGSTD